MPSNFITGRFSQIKTVSKNHHDPSEGNTSGTTLSLKPTASTNLFRGDSGNLNWGGRIGILFLMIAIAGYYTSTTNKDDSRNAVTIDAVSAKGTREEISPYIGNQLKNGASPLTECFGLADYQGDLNLTVKNRSNSDAIVCLYSTSLGRTIRNEYVQKNSFFTMSNIAQGYYKIRVFYGNDWNPNLQNYCESKGNFESDITFTEYKDQKYLRESAEGYTHTTITLYPIANDTTSTSILNRSAFFTK